MARQNDGDEFNDLDVASLGLGILKGDGGDAHHATAAKIAPDGSGMGFTVTCDMCGQRQQIVCSWDELIIVSAGQLPPGNATSQPWAYIPARGAVSPNVPCCACQRRDTLVLLTPDEASRHVRAGIQAQRITQGYVEHARQQIAQRFPAR